MTYEAFADKNFTAAHLGVINKALEIIQEYQDQGLTLTLRQLYYQFVARALIQNDQRQYKRLGKIVSNARMCGLLPWTSIEDRTRNLTSWRHCETADEAVATLRRFVRPDYWQNQNRRVEVWIEKEALVGVIERVCARHDVPFFACRGYNSQSEAWRAGKRMQRRWDRDKQMTLVLHLGDHDPSGIDMTKDNADRLEVFSDRSAEVRRIALNMDQINEHRPPPNPVKFTDSRAGDYTANYGFDSWELDALDPAVLQRVIQDHIQGEIDEYAWAEITKRKECENGILDALIDGWEGIREKLENG